MKKNLIPKTVVVIVLMAFAVNAVSQADSSKLTNLSLKDLLNVNITTASKISQSVELASAVVTVITKEQIRSRGYQSLLDVMYDLPDVKVDDKMYSGMRNSFTVRGTQGSEKFMILLDGVNISSPSGEAMPIMQNYPVHLAEQIEILYGPASALYGANAVSGIINIITRKTSRKDLAMEATQTTGSYGYTNTTLFISKKFSENTNLVVSGQYYYDRSPDYSQLYKKDSLLDISSYRTGTFNTIYGPVTPAAPVSARYEAPMEAYNLYASLHSGNFSFSFFRNYFRLPTAFENNPSNSVYNKNVYMGQDITVANASYKKLFNKITSTTSLTSSKYNMDPKSNYRNLYTAIEPAYKYSTCSMIKMEQQIDYSASDKLTFTGGAGYESYDAIPQSADLESPVNVNDYIHGSYLGTDAYYRPEGLAAQFYFIKYHNTGLYFQSQYSPSAKIHLTLGTRYDINSRYGASFNPRVGLVYQASPATTVKLLYGSAFRAPTPSDSYAQYGSFDTPDSGRSYHSYFLHLPNPGLKPVKSYNAEVNIQHHFNDNFIVAVDAYYTMLSGLSVVADDNQSTHLYNNMFNGIPVDYIEVFANSDRQKNIGGSIQLNWKHSFKNIHFNSYASLSYVNGVKESGPKERLEKIKDVQLDFIAPYMVHLGTDLKTGKFTCSPRLILMGKQNLGGIGDTTGNIIKRQTLPGYALLNISLRYNISRHLSIFTNITNALSQHYRAVGFNMDLTKKDTPYYYGQHQDPIRFMGGINFTY